MRRRAVPAVIVAVVVASAALAVTTPVTAQQQQSGPFGIDELREGGTIPSEAPEDVRSATRYLRGSDGSAPTGWVQVQYDRAQLLGGDDTMLEPDARVSTNQIELFSSAFGSGTGEYDLVIVYWSEETRTVNETERTFAVDQEVQRVSLPVSSGYSRTQVALKPHYEAEHEVTMWLERDGELVPGARWRFTHRSVQSAAPVSGIATQGDLLRWGASNVLLPGVVAVVAGLSASRLAIRRAKDGPGLGTGTWVVIGLVGAGVAATVGWFYVANLLSAAPAALALLLGTVAFGGGLRMSRETETVAVVRKELTDATSLRGSEQTRDLAAKTDGGEDGQDEIEIPEDSYQDELFENERTLSIVEEGGDRWVVPSGVKAFLGRLFADPARLSLSEVRTRVRVSGRVDERVFTDPDNESTLEHEPAGVSGRAPVWHRIDPSEEGPVTTAIYAGAAATVIGAPAIGWWAASSIGVPALAGGAIGAIVLAAEGLEARDGSISIDPAPVHFRSAIATVTTLQKEFSDAKTLEEYQEAAWSERTTTVREAREIDKRRGRTVQDELAREETGLDPVPKHGGPDPDLGGPDTDDAEISEENSDNGLAADGGEQ